MLNCFPKIYRLDSKESIGILSNNIEVTEKVDGSQFVFGKLNGVLLARSKGKVLDLDKENKQFQLAIDYIKSLEPIDVPEGMVFYCEYLSKPKHNCLKYSRVPQNNLVLFGISIYDINKNEILFIVNHCQLRAWSSILNIEAVPILFQGVLALKENENGIFQLEQDLLRFLKNDSFLGGTKIEGVVIKQYGIRDNYGISVKAAKIVSDEFKEKMKPETNKKGNIQIEDFIKSFKSEARWNKAIQYLRDAGELTNTPKDIGKLIAYLKMDLLQEEESTISQYYVKNMYEPMINKLLKHSVIGFPEFYKDYIIGQQKPDDTSATFGDN